MRVQSDLLLCSLSEHGKRPGGTFLTKRVMATGKVRCQLRRFRLRRRLAR